MPIIIPEFITPEEQTTLIEWEKTIRPDLSRNGTGSGCLFQLVEELRDVPECFHDIRRRIQAMLNFTDDQKERNYGWYLSSTACGGEVKPHCDQIETNVHHVRCNVFVQTVEHGGVPVIDDIPYPVTDRSLLCFFASEQMHSCTKVETPGVQRILCSYGYEVDGDFLRAFFPVWGTPLVHER
jgi:hypothetical protein